MKDTKRSIKRLTVSAMLVALGVVVLWLGSMVDVLSISMAVIASLFGVFALLEYGKGTPWLVFAATGILSLLLLPQDLEAAKACIEANNAAYHAIVPLEGQLKSHRDRYC